jgi:hypothetical protein
MLYITNPTIYAKDEYHVLSWFLKLLFHEACTNTQSITPGSLFSENSKIPVS